ncbi:hypothetical protein EEW87_001540 [Janibacter melonis]|uniref:Thioredoxin domain-containing protein n=1 Tax=Janibacter melonis TaxID=262209 RepID=A0A5P8FJP8_9MICO|nr:hypothetical protein [Janibacter melonis]QFQ29300.2 hypothetical protein EEW87_001540 [Janibacter melonis]
MSTPVLTTLVVVLLIAVVLLGMLVLGLLRSHALILKALHDLGAGLELDRQAERESAAGGAGGPVPVEIERGVMAPARSQHVRVAGISGATLDGAPAQVDLTSGRYLLAFLSTGCTVCGAFWQAFRAETEVPGQARLLVVAKGDDGESPSALAELAEGGAELVRSSAAWDDFVVPGSPYFVYLVDGDIVGEGSASSWPQVSDLMGQAVADHEHRTAAPFEDRGERDDPTSVDAELRAAGLGPGHPSLYPDPSGRDGA